MTRSVKLQCSARTPGQRQLRAGGRHLFRCQLTQKGQNQTLHRREAASAQLAHQIEFDMHAFLPLRDDLPRCPTVRYPISNVDIVGPDTMIQYCLMTGAP